MANLGDTFVLRFRLSAGTDMKAKCKLRIITGRREVSTILHLPKREILCRTRAASLQKRLKQKRRRVGKAQKSKDWFVPSLPQAATLYNEEHRMDF